MPANKNITQLIQQTGSADSTTLLYSVVGSTSDRSLPLSVLFNAPNFTSSGMWALTNPTIGVSLFGESLGASYVTANSTTLTDSSSHAGHGHSAMNVTTQPIGTGNIGPTNADFAITASALKQNFGGAASAGEIDTMYLVARNGGSNSDTTAVLFDVANYGTGFNACYEGNTSQIVGSTITHTVDVQSGVVDTRTNNYYGYVVNKSVGLGGVAYLAQQTDNVGQTGQWQHLLQFVGSAGGTGAVRYDMPIDGNDVVSIKLYDISFNSKTVRCNSNNFSILNSAGSSEILQLTDIGGLTATSSVVSGSIGAGISGVPAHTLQVQKNTTDTPAQGAYGSGIAGSATVGQLYDGSLSNPHTANTPSFSISRWEAQNSNTLTGNAPALWVETVSHNTGTGNPNSNSILGVATQYGVGDCVGLCGIAMQEGTGNHYAYGGFLNASAGTAGSAAYALETYTDNRTGANSPLVLGSTPVMVGLHVTAGGPSNTTDTAAVWISNDSGNGVNPAQWDCGTYLSPGSVVTYGYCDDSSSNHIIFAGGSHQYGLNFINATFSGAAITTPGFSVGTTGIVTSTGVSNGSNAAAGQVGEYISASATAVSNTSGIAVNVISISLTAGDWDVSGSVITNASTNLQQILCGITNVSATSQSEFNNGRINYGSPVAGANASVVTPTCRYNLTTTTTIYLFSNCAFTSGTCTSDGQIRARRVR